MHFAQITLLYLGPPSSRGPKDSIFSFPFCSPTSCQSSDSCLHPLLPFPLSRLAKKKRSWTVYVAWRSFTNVSKEKYCFGKVLGVGEDMGQVHERWRQPCPVDMGFEVSYTQPWILAWTLAYRVAQKLLPYSEIKFPPAVKWEDSCITLQCL